MTDAFICEAIRTPRGRGKKTGSLHSVKPVDLVVGLIDKLQARHPGLDPAAIDDIVLGVVTPVGDQGCDIAKTAALRPGFRRPLRACSSTASGSGLEAVAATSGQGRGSC